MRKNTDCKIACLSVKKESLKCPLEEDEMNKSYTVEYHTNENY